MNDSQIEVNFEDLYKLKFQMFIMRGGISDMEEFLKCGYVDINDIVSGYSYLHWVFFSNIITTDILSLLFKYGLDLRYITEKCGDPLELIRYSFEDEEWYHLYKTYYTIGRIS